jgi:hypothetical protein
MYTRWIVVSISGWFHTWKLLVGISVTIKVVITFVVAISIAIFKVSISIQQLQPIVDHLIINCKNVRLLALMLSNAFHTNVTLNLVLTLGISDGFDLPAFVLRVVRSEMRFVDTHNQHVLTYQLRQNPCQPDAAVVV